MAEEKERVYTPKEVGKILKVRPNTVIKWIKRGKLKGKKQLNGRWIIYEKDLTDLFEGSTFSEEKKAEGKSYLEQIFYD